MKKSLSSKDKLKSVNQKPMQASGKISPRRKIPKEIKHSDSELTRIAFETALTANSIADKNGVIINANNSFLKTWGYSSLKDVIGKPIPFFIKYKKDVEQILQALNTNGKWEGNYTALRKDKTEFTAHGLATTLRDSSNNIIGYQSSVMDISDRKEIENNLIQSELRFRNIFNQSPVGAVIVSLEKKFIQCNHSFCQYLGYTDTELVGNYIADVTYPEDVNIGMPELKLMAEGRLDLALVHKRYVDKDGGIVWGEVTMTLVRNAENKPN